MTLRTRIAIILGKIVSWVSKTFRLGAGATWPGEIALRIEPRLLHILTHKIPHLILVAGTNGKTTTAKMIQTIIGGVRNTSGANLDNGLVSVFLTNKKEKYYILEVDEATLPNILKEMTPEIVVLTNLFRDQLDRYGEVDVIAEKWSAALEEVDKRTTVIINADDPHLAFIGTNIRAQVKYFGLEDPSLYLPNMQHATDTIYCPGCGNRLTFTGVYFSHLGEWSCTHCAFKKPSVIHIDVQYPIEGVYNKYNTVAAALTAEVLGIHHDAIREGLAKFIPAFGRMENIVVEGRRVKILLSKNPTGFNESLRTVANSADRGPVLFMLNDRIPDGRDVSWIWDVDFELYKDFPRYLVSGDRAYDMGLRLKYAGISAELISDIRQAVFSVGENEVLWILPTYSAMLDVRKILTGRKIL